ncbi:AraC family transcriptional regulator [Ectopseudomonas alcaliphila]|uniref:AraC family transcriptional regulator n=1 Tax=Ectopseudomonas alcaliphila TaxID=101564 RepID=A0A1G7LQ38_9GAMM|nr:AraC family transcriptional regulator [Pseudomonas alcaliphila]MDX5995052.1 AraC family transcriptional regulator [Pseudomonas alcaliphila]SDF51069.1 AraC-type DNA-binding protein [Pseudomonas alcaliphila]
MAIKASRVRLGDLSVGFTQALAGALREQGQRPEPLFEQFGLDAASLSEPRARLSIPRFMRLGHSAIALCEEPALGLDMGRHSHPSQIGLAGICAAQAPDLREAARTLTRFEPLYAANYRGRSGFDEDPRGAWLLFYSISPYNAYNRFVVDSVLAGWQTNLGQVVDRPITPEKVEIEFPAPDYGERYEALFGCPVEFAASANRLRLSNDTLALRNPQHCPGTWRHLVELCERELEQLTRTRSLRERVIQLLGPLLHGHEPDLQEVARSLQLPSWTLRRKLAEEGTQFRTILNDTRRDLATAYIRDTELAFGEIAYLLGFASAEAFQRAFKRWLGQTPGDYRRAQRRAG